MFVSFVVAMVATMALIPLLVRMSAKLGMLDHPGPRKVHDHTVPRVGGIAILVGLLIPVFVLQNLPRPIVGILIGIFIVVAEGIWDDRKSLSYRQKFLGQFLAALAVVGIGDVQIRELVIWNEILLPEWFSFPLTVLVIVALTNAINLADGLDGLAGGVSFLCCAALGLLAYTSGNTPALILALALCGALVGFLRFNTFPARVFMGDGGSQLLGLTIASLAIYVTQAENAIFSATVPLFLLAIPILDTLFVFVQRIREGRSPFSPDKNHLHHRLLAFGLTHTQAVALIYCAQCLLMATAYLLRFESDLVNLGAFAAIGIAMLITLVRQPQDTGEEVTASPDRPRFFLKMFDDITRDVLHRLAMQILFMSLIAYCVMAIGLLVVPFDIGLLLAGLLVVTAVVSSFGASRWRGALTRSVVYILAAVLSYLFVQSGAVSPEMHRLETVLVAMIAVATVVGLRFGKIATFQLNTMDLLVLFTAIVIPNLPGTAWSDTNLPSLAARLAVLFYAMELALNDTRENGRIVSFAAGVVMLALVLRGFF